MEQDETGLNTESVGYLAEALKSLLALAFI
jgi:hypothetical protein